MNKILYGLLSCCTIACGDQKPVTPQDTDELIVKNVCDNYPLAIKFIQNQKNEVIINTLRQSIISYIKSVQDTDENKTLLAQMLVKFITYDNPTTLDQNMIAEKMETFRKVIEYVGHMINLESKISSYHKRMWIAFSVAACLDFDLNKLRSKEVLLKIKYLNENLNIDDNTHDILIYSQIYHIFTPGI